MEHTKHIDDTLSIFLPFYLSIPEGRHTCERFTNAPNFSCNLDSTYVGYRGYSQHLFCQGVHQCVFYKILEFELGVVEQYKSLRFCKNGLLIVH